MNKVQFVSGNSQTMLFKLHISQWNLIVVYNYLQELLWCAIGGIVVMLALYVEDPRFNSAPNYMK